MSAYRQAVKRDERPSWIGIRLSALRPGWVDSCLSAFGRKICKPDAFLKIDEMQKIQRPLALKLDIKFLIAVDDAASTWAADLGDLQRKKLLSRPKFRFNKPRV
jgi:hypothetical protein